MIPTITICLVTFIVSFFHFRKASKPDVKDTFDYMKADLDFRLMREKANAEVQQRLYDMDFYIQYSRERRKQDMEEELRLTMLNQFPDEWKYKFRPLQVLDMRFSGGIYMVYDQETARYSGNTRELLEADYQKGKEKEGLTLQNTTERHKQKVTCN